jgi:hypothetical protein
MDAATRDRLSRRIGTPGTRRAAVGLLLGSLLLGGRPGAAARGKTRRKRKQHGAHRAKRTRDRRVHQEGAPVVIGPETDAGLEENFANCGTFMVQDRFNTVFTLRLFFDNAGDLVRGVEQVSGTDTFINSVTGKAITAPFHNNVLIDFTSDPPLGANSGVLYKVTVPGAGAVFLDV